MKIEKVICFTAVLLVILSVIALAIISHNRRVPSIGTVTAVGVDVFWDAGCTQNVTLIDWGGIDPGETVEKLLYIRNISTGSANLTLFAGDWSPNATADYVTLTWDYNGSLLSVGEVRPTVFMLTVAGDVVGITNFSFNITIRTMI